MSSGWGPVTAEQAEEAFRTANDRPSRFLMNGGLYEPGFHHTTRRSADALRAAGFDARYEAVAAGHAADQWDAMLARDLVEVLGGRR
jgi:enterochelin esterase-like enzyme